MSLTISSLSAINSYHTGSSSNVLTSSSQRDAVITSFQNSLDKGDLDTAQSTLNALRANIDTVLKTSTSAHASQGRTLLENDLQRLSNAFDSGTGNTIQLALNVLKSDMANVGAGLFGKQPSGLAALFNTTPASDPATQLLDTLHLGNPDQPAPAATNYASTVVSIYLSNGSTTTDTNSVGNHLDTSA